MDLNKPMNDGKSQSIARGALPVLSVMALAGALSACGGGSNNLPDPSISPTTGFVACSDTTKCITTQFIVDSPVAGLNYTCGTYNNITDATGTVSCENNSNITFFLQSTDAKRKVTLGTYTLKKGVATLIRITPNDLVPPSTLAIGTITAGAVNITQLLETLRSPNYSYNPSEPTSRLVLDSTVKDAMNALTKDIAATDMSNGTFIDTFQPILTQLGRTLISKDDATARLNQGLQVLQAGSYYSSPGLILSGLLGGADVATQATGVATNDKALLGLYNVIDRSGFLIGQGAEWHGDTTPLDSSGKPTTGTATAYTLLTNGSGFTRLSLSNSTVSAPSFLNPVNNFVNSNYVWQPEAVTLNTNGFWQPQTNTPLGTATFTNGRLIGGTYIVGNNTLWQNVTQPSPAATAPVNEIATWKQANNSNPSYYNGTMTLTKSRSVDSFLDPVVFKTASNVGPGNKAIFPLYATLTFHYTNTTNCTAGCVLGTQGIVILANGNIITDMKQDCSPADATTLLSPSADPTKPTQQKRIGLIGAAFQGVSNINNSYISPLIMLSGHEFDQVDSTGVVTGTLDGIQVGTLSTIISQVNSVKVNVAGISSRNINISDNTNVTTTDSQTGVVTVVSTGEQSVLPAAYTNFYDSWNALKSTQATTDTAITARSKGTVTMALTQCYAQPIGK